MKITIDKELLETILKDAFESGVAYWNPQHGWEENAYNNWKQSDKIGPDYKRTLNDILIDLNGDC